MRASPFLFLLILPGCAGFESILEGLADFVDANDDGPRFVYADAADDPIIRFASITPDDKSLPRSSNRLGISGSTVLALSQSPDGGFGGGGWDEVFADVSDFGVFIFNADTGAKELFLTDNNVTLDDELACKVSDIAEETRAAIAPQLPAFFPDLSIDPATLTFNVDVIDDSGNFLGFVGWTRDNQLVARYEYQNGTTIAVPDPGFDIAPEDWEPPRIIGQLLFERETDGSWVADACPDPFPRTVRAIPTRDVTLTLSGSGFPRTGDIFLDGVRLNAALGDTPLSRGRTTHLSGAW